MNAFNAGVVSVTDVDGSGALEAIVPCSPTLHESTRVGDIFSLGQLAVERDLVRLRRSWQKERAEHVREHQSNCASAFRPRARRIGQGGKLTLPPLPSEIE